MSSSSCAPGGHYIDDKTYEFIFNIETADTLRVDISAVDNFTKEHLGDLVSELQKCAVSHG